MDRRMFGWRRLFVQAGNPAIAGQVLLICLLLGWGCGATKGPTTPGDDLIGTWAYVRTDMGETIAGNLHDYLVDLGLPQSIADSLAQEFAIRAEALTSDWHSLLHFEPDGTYRPEDGDAGTWSVSGQDLTLRLADGGSSTARYSVDGDGLILAYGGDEILRRLGEERDTWTQEDQEASSWMLGKDDIVRLWFRRRQ